MKTLGLKTLGLSLCHIDLLFEKLKNESIPAGLAEKPHVEDLLCSMKSTFNAQAERYKSNLLYCTKAAQGVVPECIKNVKTNEANNPVIYYQGVEGAWAHIAAKKMYPTTPYVNVLKFKDVFENVSKTENSVGILPIDNSTAGAVAEVYDYLMKYNLFINKCINIPINHCLASTSDNLATVKRVISHPQALAQCSEIIESLNLNIETSLNTAIAAAQVAKNANKEEAVLCSKEAALNANLIVLKELANNNRFNETRFISVSKILTIPDNANRISLILTIKHEKGSLNEIISTFSDFNLNLTKIQSRPIPDKPFQFCFYLDFEGNINSLQTKAILLKFENELPDFRFIGNYE